MVLALSKGPEHPKKLSFKKKEDKIVFVFLLKNVIGAQKRD